jgi:murein DD-endopeptidase MepM/ murein hydrolase activator NlpD
LPPARRIGVAALTLAACALATLSTSRAFARTTEPESRGPVVAGAFVFPVGDELDFTEAHKGEATGFYISDSYLVRRGRHGQRTHKGVDLANGRGGSTVRAIASGVVVVADANAMIKIRTPKTVKTTTHVNGKRVTKTRTRYRTTYKWRTGWGNYVVIRHVLPSGEVVHSLYGHLKPKSILVQKGDIIAAGQPIAQVGRTGRATSPHLHLEIRKALPVDEADDFDPEEVENATVEDRSFALLQTVDPISFLSQHVRRYDDLDPHSWEAPYALAACRDGIVSGDGDKFDPDDPITRSDWYSALVQSFQIEVAATPPNFAELRAGLALAGVLESDRNEGERAGDRLPRTEALSVLLRCLEKFPAHGANLAAFERERLCGDFNRVFAGPEAADRAKQEALNAALAATAARRKAADEEYARAVKAASAKSGAKKKRVKRQAVKPVPPVPRLDPGFEAISRSDRALSRSEACLLLASGFRIGHERLSALEQAATRTATASSE